MSTIHNPSQFQPQDYSVIDYFDNQPPQYYLGLSPEAFQSLRDMWLKDRNTLFPEQNCYHCQHCGNGNVRYVAAVTHIPTGKRVCFGNDCVVRLEFANQNELKLAQIKARAEAGNARMRIWKQRETFLTANPEVQTFIDEAQKPVHSSNYFVADVLGKLNVYGSLSPAQVNAVRNSLARDVKFAEAKANDTRPALQASDRRQITGVVISQKTQTGIYGTQFKMLVELPDGNRIWGTEPSAVDIHKGDTVEFSAKIEVSDKDAHFGFFQRPTKAKILNSPATTTLVSQAA